MTWIDGGLWVGMVGIFLGGLLILSFLLHFQRKCDDPTLWESSSFLRAPYQLNLLYPSSPLVHAWNQVIRSNIYALYVIYQLGIRGWATYRSPARTFRFDLVKYGLHPRRISDLTPSPPLSIAKTHIPPPDLTAIIIVLHGIRSGPYSSFALVEQLQQQLSPEHQKTCLLLAPALHLYGNAPVETLTQELWDRQIGALMSKVPIFIPVTIIGTSLGGLVACQLRLNMEAKRRVHIVTLGSPLRGTLWADVCSVSIPYGFNPWKWFLKRDPHLLQELKLNAPARLKTLETLSSPTWKPTTWFIFASTLYDVIILPSNSCLPSMESKRTKYLLFKTSNHIGIQVEAASQCIEELLAQWNEAEKEMGI